MRQSIPSTISSSCKSCPGSGRTLLGTEAQLMGETKRHHVNSAPIFLTINAQSWIPPETKARLLEWKIRMDLIEYAARGTPPLAVDRIAEYQPRDGSLGKTPLEIVSRLHGCADDGHAIKLGRAALICHDLCKKYGDKSWINIKGDELWSKVYHLIVDSVETPGPRWVRACGMDEAWEVRFASPAAAADLLTVNRESPTPSRQQSCECLVRARICRNESGGINCILANLAGAMPIPTQPTPLRFRPPHLA